MKAYAIDELNLLLGDDIRLTDNITVHQPKLDEIRHCEKEYLSTVSTLTTVPFDIPYQLKKINVDFTLISEWELFILLTRSITNKDTNLLFGDEIDFSKMKAIKSNGSIILSDGKIEIDESIYKQLASLLRKMHGFKKNHYSKVYNDFAKQQLIEEEKRDLERAKKLAVYRSGKSAYSNIISTLVNKEGFKYNWQTVKELTIYQLISSYQRIQVIDNAEHLYTGLYSGCIKFETAKSGLDIFKEI